MAKKKMTPEEAVRFTLNALYDSVFPELTPHEVMERLRGAGYHHQFMEMLYPATDKLSDMAYARSLDEFEAELDSWVMEAATNRHQRP
jgi:hypothetical protein